MLRYLPAERVLSRDTFPLHFGFYETPVFPSGTRLKGMLSSVRCSVH